MRVSDRLRFDLSADRVGKAKSDNASMLEKLSTQKDINRVSDDPVGFSKVIRVKNRIEKMKEYQKNIDYSKGFIETAEVSATGILDNLIRAKELSVAMGNSTYDAKSREATSHEINEIMNSVVSLANTQFDNRYVFGGFRTKTPALSLDGQYLGDDGAMFLKTGQDTFQKVNINSRHFFEATDKELEQGKGSLYSSLELLKSGLKSNNEQEIQKSMYQLDYQIEKATTYQAKLGAIYTSLNHANNRLEQGIELAVTNLSKTEDADMYEVSSDFKRTETVLNSTLMASNKLLQPTLLSFMQ